MVRFLRKYALAGLVWVLYRSISFTWKSVIEEPEEMKQLIAQGVPLVLAHWHGDELALLSLVKKYRIATITSTSKDGELMNTVLHFMGVRTSRGSSTRGGVNALKGLVRILKSESRNCSFAVDGPKGPLHEIKPGVFEISRITKAPIFCAGVSCDSKWVFEKAWNKTYFPKPFSRIVFQWVGPIGPVSSSENPRDPTLSNSMKDAMHRAEALSSKKMDALLTIG